MSTLLSVLNRLPAVLRTRYGGSNYQFWVDTCNSIVEEFQEMGLGPDNKKIVPYPRSFLHGAATLPSTLMYLGDIRSEDGEKIVFTPYTSDSFVVDSSEEDDEAAITTWDIDVDSEPAHQYSNGKVWRAIAESQADPDSFVGKAVMIYSGQVPRITVLRDGFVIEAAKNVGPYLYVVIPPGVQIDTTGSWTYETFPTYVNLIGKSKAQPIVLVGDEIPMPDNFNKFLLAGLRYYGEIQTDESSANARYWGEEWKKAKRMALATSAKHRGQVFNAKPSQSITLSGY